MIREQPRKSVDLFARVVYNTSPSINLFRKYPCLTGAYHCMRFDSDFGQFLYSPQGRAEPCCFIYLSCSQLRI